VTSGAPPPTERTNQRSLRHTQAGSDGPRRRQPGIDTRRTRGRDQPPKQSARVAAAPSAAPASSPGSRSGTCSLRCGAPTRPPRCGTTWPGRPDRHAVDASRRHEHWLSSEAAYSRSKNLAGAIRDTVRQDGRVKDFALMWRIQRYGRLARLPRIVSMGPELLGFDADARVLILNCDDLGMHEAVNVAIFDSIENGVATSCSLMVPCPGAADAIRMLRERPHVPCGIHLTLIRDKPSYVWGPSSPKADVPSLLDPDTGELFTDEPVNRNRMLAQARLDDVERELRTQINTVFDAGLSPTHLDWHCLGDGGRGDIFDLGLALADEYGLAARVWLDDGCQKARSLGKPVVDGTWLDSFTVGVEGKSQTYARLLRALPSGLSEWAVHPALATKDWQAIEQDGWRVRQSDHAFLMSGGAREILAEEGINVIDYTLVQNVWRASPGDHFTTGPVAG